MTTQHVHVKIILVQFGTQIHLIPLGIKLFFVKLPFQAALFYKEVILHFDPWTSTSGNGGSAAALGCGGGGG